MIKWISVKEYLPSGDEDVLVCNGKEIAMLKIWKCNGKNHWIAPSYIFGNEYDVIAEFEFENTTHWARIDDLKP